MRKTAAKKRFLEPDPKFGDTLVTRFVNDLMQDGKKSVAFKIFYDAVEQVEKTTGESGLETWRKALHNIMPGVEVKSRRIGLNTLACVKVKPWPTNWLPRLLLLQKAKVLQ
jgi:small subunit ribosomal protein S7